MFDELLAICVHSLKLGLIILPFREGFVVPFFPSFPPLPFSLVTGSQEALIWYVSEDDLELLTLPPKC